MFNHFASLDDVLLAVCTETLDVVAEQVRLFPGPGERSGTAAVPRCSRHWRKPCAPRT